MLVLVLVLVLVLLDIRISFVFIIISHGDVGDAVILRVPPCIES